MRYKAIVSFRTLEGSSSLYTLYVGDGSKIRFFVPFAMDMFNGKDPYVSGFSEGVVYPADTKWYEVDYSTVMCFSEEDSRGLYVLAESCHNPRASKEITDNDCITVAMLKKDAKNIENRLRLVLDDSAYVIKTNTDEFRKHVAASVFKD